MTSRIYHFILDNYSSHRRGSGPNAQTLGVDSFKKNTRSNTDSSGGSLKLVLLEINSVAKGGLTTIFDVEEKISQIRKIHFRALTGAPGN